MSSKIKVVSYSIHGRVNVGAYERPYSGVGIEYDPLSLRPGRSGITLHESGYLPGSTNWNFPSVFSPFWRLYFNQRRGHAVVLGERTVELTPQHVVLIPPHVLFHCRGTRPVPTFWLAFSFTRQLHPEHSLPVQLPPRDTELCLIRDLQRLIRADETWAPTDAIFRTSLALLQVILARRELRWQAPLPATMARSRELIEAQLGSALPNPRLARAVGLSVAGFVRSFRRYFGTTPARYVTETRVREAARLLLQSDLTLDAIAEQTGFPNRAYFSRVFKKISRESPALFRAQHARR